MNFQNLLLTLVVMIPPMLLAVTLHELAHGWMAFRLGDPTAKKAGRLTMNPLKHLDFFGTLALSSRKGSVGPSRCLLILSI